MPGLTPPFHGEGAAPSAPAASATIASISIDHGAHGAEMALHALSSGHRRAPGSTLVVEPFNGFAAWL